MLFGNTLGSKRIKIFQELIIWWFILHNNYLQIFNSYIHMFFFSNIAFVIKNSTQFVILKSKWVKHTTPKQPITTHGYQAYWRWRNHQGWKWKLDSGFTNFIGQGTIIQANMRIERLEIQIDSYLENNLVEDKNIETNRPL